jgi:hypothetical protein
VYRHLSLPGNHGGPVVQPHAIVSDFDFFELDIARSNGTDHLRLWGSGSFQNINDDEILGEDPVEDFNIRMNQCFEEFPGSVRRAAIRALQGTQSSGTPTWARASNGDV